MELSKDFVEMTPYVNCGVAISVSILVSCVHFVSTLLERPFVELVVTLYIKIRQITKSSLVHTKYQMREY